MKSKLYHNDMLYFKSGYESHYFYPAVFRDQAGHKRTILLTPLEIDDAIRRGERYRDIEFHKKKPWYMRLWRK